MGSVTGSMFRKGVPLSLIVMAASAEITTPRSIRQIPDYFQDRGKPAHFIGHICVKDQSKLSDDSFYHCYNQRFIMYFEVLYIYWSRPP